MATHLDRTAHVARSQEESKATVISISNASPTVKLLSLKVHDKETVCFKPGQWIDFRITSQPVLKVGGYSICSPPNKLRVSGLIDVAVKWSSDQPANWIHDSCRLGTEVMLRVGGDFHYDLDPSVTPVDQRPSNDLVLIAGGIGITPCISIIYHMIDLYRNDESVRQQSSSGQPVTLYRPGNIRLLYSAANLDELLFRKSLMYLSEECPIFSYQMFVTRHEDCLEDMHVKKRRIVSDDISQSISEICRSRGDEDKSNILCYICGPRDMIEACRGYASEAGICEDMIRYEMWT